MEINSIQLLYGKGTIIKKWRHKETVTYLVGWIKSSKLWKSEKAQGLRLG